MQLRSFVWQDPGFFELVFVIRIRPTETGGGKELF